MTIKDSVLFYIFQQKHLLLIQKDFGRNHLAGKKLILSSNKLAFPLKGFALCVDYSFTSIILKCLCLSG